MECSEPRDDEVQGRGEEQTAETEGHDKGDSFVEFTQHHSCPDLLMSLWSPHQCKEAVRLLIHVQAVVRVDAVAICDVIKHYQQGAILQDVQLLFVVQH